MTANVMGIIGYDLRMILSITETSLVLIEGMSLVVGESLYGVVPQLCYPISCTLFYVAEMVPTD